MSASMNNLNEAWRYINACGESPRRRHLCAFAEQNNLYALDLARENFFHDHASRSIYDWFCQYRIVESYVGREAADLMPNSPMPRTTWLELERQSKDVPGLEGDYPLDRIDVWILEGYALKGKCEAAAGDVVLDCGSFTGNTCLYFSRKVGPGGKVYAFEPIPSIFGQLQKNMADVNNVSLINAAVSDSKDILDFSDCGAGSHQNSGGVKVCAFSLDGFFKNAGLEKVDFIKMDIEGSEEKALLGAAGLIRRFRPKMAISVYHREADIVTIPALIREIEPEYKFSLRHLSPTVWETVLYCYCGL